MKDTAIRTTNLPSSSSTSSPFFKLWLISLCFFLLFLFLSASSSWSVKEGLEEEVDTKGNRESLRVKFTKTVEWNCWNLEITIPSRNRPWEQGPLPPSTAFLVLFFLTFLLVLLSRESRRRLRVARAPRRRRRTSKRWAERRRGKRAEQEQQGGGTGGRTGAVWGSETGGYKTEEETDDVGEEQGG